MNYTVMGGLIYNYILKDLEPVFKGDYDLELMRKICNDIAQGVVEHIQQAAVVTGTAPSGGGSITNGKVS